jgi:hypothetical protein
MTSRRPPHNHNSRATASPVAGPFCHSTAPQHYRSPASTAPQHRRSPAKTSRHHPVNHMPQHSAQTLPSMHPTQSECGFHRHPHPPEELVSHPFIRSLRADLPSSPNDRVASSTIQLPLCPGEQSCSSPWPDWPRNRPTGNSTRCKRSSRRHGAVLSMLVPPELA